jgi:hypothetical protein
MFMNDLGHFSRDYAVSDSFAVRALWEQMRYAAGDYQNGCTDPSSDYFNPEARVNDGSCDNGQPISIAGQRKHFGKGRSIQLQGLFPSLFALPFAPEKNLKAELHDLTGKVVWRSHHNVMHSIDRVTGPKPGMYLLRLRDEKHQIAYRVLLDPHLKR